MKPSSIIIFTLIIIFAVSVGAILTWTKNAPSTYIKKDNTNYKCPRTELLDCSDSASNASQEKLCNDADYINWIVENCPDFKGITR